MQQGRIVSTITRRRLLSLSLLCQTTHPFLWGRWGLRILPHQNPRTIWTRRIARRGLHKRPALTLRARTKNSMAAFTRRRGLFAITTVSLARRPKQEGVRAHHNANSTEFVSAWASAIRQLCNLS